MEDQLIYPQSYIAMGNGDLTQVTDFTAALTNDAKQVHTQRRSGAGIVKGKPKSNISFNFSIDENGPERDYWRLVQKGTIKQLRVKAPGGKTLTFNGAFSGVTLNGPLEDATTGSCTFIGKLEDQ